MRASLNIYSKDEVDALGGNANLPPMTSDATPNTLALRDNSGNSKFNVITANNITFTQGGKTSNTADTWFLSGGQTSANGVKKNDAAGMRSSLDVYSKDEVDAIEYPETNLDGYATEEYVDDSIAAIEFPPPVDISNKVSKTGGDFMEGPLDINAVDPTNSRATNKVITLGIFSQSEGSALRLGTTRDRVYVGHNDTSFNGPIKVDEIDSKSGNGVKLIEEGTADNHLITKSYVDSGDNALQAEITELALALNTLLVQKTHGQWKYIGFMGDHIPRNAGEFALGSDDLTSSTNIIQINNTDLNGMTIGFGDVDIGDYVEIVDVGNPSKYVLFVVSGKPNGTGISDIAVTLKEKGNNFLIGATCEIRFFELNEQDINLSELDDRYALKSEIPDTSDLATIVYSDAEDAKIIARVQALEEGQGPGGPGESVTQTLLGKGMWAKSIDEIATDKFIGFDYNGNTRNNLDQYTMGIAIAGRFGNEYTDGLEWKQGAYVDVYDSSGNLIFCEEINSVEHDAKGYLRLHWEYMPTMYIAQNRNYGDVLMLKVTNLTGTARQMSRISPTPPPLDDPDIGE